MAQVLVRLHPTQSQSCIQVNSTSQLKIHSQLTCEELNFDVVADGFYSQQDIFEQIGAPIAASLKTGHNGLVVALGQSGSGKSFTLFGNDCQAKGLVQMIVNDLRIKGFQVSISCYQIFNEQILDLLCPIPRARQLKQVNNHSSVAQLIQLKILPLHNIHSLLWSWLRNRKSAKLASSSKSVVVVTLTTRRQNSNNYGKLEFVQLSGYQNVYNNGSNLELSGMNSKSTSSFLRMISGSTSTQFKFSESKLTELMKNCFLHNCDRYIIAHIRAQKKHLNETLYTLEVANKSKDIGKNKSVISGFSTLNECSSNINLTISSDSRRDSLVKYAPDPIPMNIIINNQKHLKNLIQLYEDRIYHIQNKQITKRPSQKKILEKVAHQYAALLKNFPTFSQILAQNMELKQQTSEKNLCSPFSKKPKQGSKGIPSSSSLKIISHQSINSQNSEQIISKQSKMLQQYESMISMFQEEFVHKLSQLSRYYSYLQNKFNQETKKQIHYRNASIKDFIIEDDQIQNLRSQVCILKSQNKELRLKNKQLRESTTRQGMGYFELQSLKQRLVQIQKFMIKDEELKNQYLKEIDVLKSQLLQKQTLQKQNYKHKIQKITDRSNDTINLTTSTLFFDELNPHLLKENNVMKKNKFQMSCMIQKTYRNDKILDLRKPNDSQNLSLPLQCTLPHNYIKQAHLEITSQKKQRSQLQRLRLILLKSKQKTNRTKLNYIKSSQKNKVTSKNSIFQRSQYSTFSSRCNSRPDLHLATNEQTLFKRKRSPLISERGSFRAVKTQY